MTRVLKRPMFRLGGNTDQGIMSGVVPRQGYSIGGVSDEEMQRIQKVAKQYAYRPTGYTPAQGLIEWGLNIASAEPKGSIFATAAEEAKGPFAKYAKSKAESEAIGRMSESDLFSTLFKGAVEAGTGGKSYAHRDKAAMVRENMDKQYGIYDQLAALDKEAPEYADQREQLLRSLRKLKEEVSSDEFAAAQLKYWSDDRNKRNLDAWIQKELEKKLGVPLDLENNAEHITAFTKRRAEIMRDVQLGIPPTFDFATGGRVGYANAGSVMDSPLETGRLGMQPPEDVMTMPEELSGISYEELRARLPQEVDDQIVRLLANSAEALEDFAVIQTEQDIANFNKKYGVNLVLPAEG